MKQLEIPEGKKVFFASDNHLGAPNQAASLPREQAFVRWLEGTGDESWRAELE